MIRCPEDHKIVIHGLPSGIAQRNVEAYFNRIGRIADIWLKDTGLDSFGFVGFESKSDYEEALRHHGRELDGHIMHIRSKTATQGHARKKSQDANKIYVRGIGNASDEAIRGFFEKIGRVNDYFRKPDADFCFVGFENAADQAHAVKRSGDEICGNCISVEPKISRTNADRGRGGRDGDTGDRVRPRDSYRRRSRTPRRDHHSRSPSRRPRKYLRSPPRYASRHRSRSPKRRRRSRS